MIFCGCTEAFGTGAAQVKLPSPHITFRVDSDLPGFSRADFEAACMEAWKRWERVIGVKVDKHANTKTDPTQFVIVTPMDGGSGVLADQELPYGKGSNLRMRVDASERWTANDKPGPGQINLLAVLCHEDGHCLGMQHFAPEGDVDLLNPTYSPQIFAPQEDDISYARKLYGPPIVSPAPTPSPLSGHAILVRQGSESIELTVDFPTDSSVAVKIAVARGQKKTTLSGQKSW